MRPVLFLGALALRDIDHGANQLNELSPIIQDRVPRDQDPRLAVRVRSQSALLCVCLVRGSLRKHVRFLNKILEPLALKLLGRPTKHGGQTPIQK
jgi:hypothetical protein